MSLFDKLFGKKSHPFKSRYTPSMLAAALEKLYFEELPERDYSNSDIMSLKGKKFPAEIMGELFLSPPEKFEYDRIEVYIYLPEEEARTLLKDLFMALYLVDDFVNADANQYEKNGRAANTEIAVISLYGGRADIRYYPEDFDVKVFLKEGIWYCSSLGLRKYEPPICVYDLAKYAAAKG